MPDPSGFRFSGSGCRDPRFGFQVLGSEFRASGYMLEMCSGAEAGSYLRRIDFVYHSSPGLRVIKKKRSYMLAENVCGAARSPGDSKGAATCTGTCFEASGFRVEGRGLRCEG